MKEKEKKWEYEIVSRISSHYLILKKGENVRGSIRIDRNEEELWASVIEFMNERKES